MALIIWSSLLLQSAERQSAATIDRRLSLTKYVVPQLFICGSHFGPRTTSNNKGPDGALA